MTSRRDFMPFGEELNAGTPNRTESAKYTLGGDSLRKKFTGYEKDAETGLDFAEARYYNNQHGRFTAVDPLLASGKSADPQSFNRYVYALNNPLIFTDHTGLQVGLPKGQWHYPVDAGGNSLGGEKYKYILNGDPTNGYLPVTATNRDGELVGSGAGLSEDFAIRFNPYGPARINNPGDLDDVLWNGKYVREGWEVTLSDIYYAKFVEPYVGVRDNNAEFYGMVFSIGSTIRTSFAGATIRAVETKAVTTESLAVSEELFPAIKQGSSGGETEFSRYISTPVRRDIVTENPNSVCVFCRQPAVNPHLDHAIPLSRGGNSTVENIQITCSFCNLSKGARDFPVNPAPGYKGPFPPPWWMIQR